MEILKQLNLNGNPQAVPEGSLIFAKNIKLSEDGTYITNDDGLDIAFAKTQPEDDELKVSSIIGEFVQHIKSYDREYISQKLVGYINCPNEVVLFVHKVYEENEETIELSEIYRAVETKNGDNLVLFKVPNAWKYDGGNIVGTYTYNAYNHLIVAIAEYDASYDKQLLTIDLNTSSYNDSLNRYSCAPNIPICNLNLVNKIKGNPMPRGIYYFFVRYEIAPKTYTNWFPIGAPQYALSLDYKTIINHTYPKNEADDIDLATTEVSALVNTDKDSYYNFAFTIEFNEHYSYENYQIGYILQTEDSSVGRLWKTFSFNDGIVKSFTFNGGYTEEVSLEDFARNVLNVYDVKALTNYNNRLYLANFKETKYNVHDDEIQKCVDKIIATQIKHKLDLDVQNKQTVVLVTWTYKIDEDEASITVPSDITSIPFSDFPELISIIDSHMIYPSYLHPDSIIGRFDGYGYSLVLSTKGIIVKPTYDWERGEGVEMIANYTGPINNNTGFIWRGKDNRYEFVHIGDDDCKGYVPFGIKITKTSGVEDYASYNSDTVIRTLMPYEVYAFYVHYVREDGSFTNGYPLNNTSLDLGDTYRKRIRELNETELAFLHLEGIATIPEMKDKYVYEIETVSLTDPSNLSEPFVPYLSESGRYLFRAGAGAITLYGVTYLLRIGVQFSNITYPKGFVGCFFTYENVRNLSVCQPVVIESLGDANGSVLCKTNDVESVNTRYDGTIFIPHHKVNIGTGQIESVSNEPKYAYINNAAPVLSNATIDFLGSAINRQGTHGGIAMNLSENINTVYTPNNYIVGNIITFDRSIYSAENKELIPFGPIITGNVYGERSDASDTSINYNMNYPSFLVKDNLLIYNDRIYIDESSCVHLLARQLVNDKPTYVIQDDVFYNKDTPYAKLDSIWKFSNVNLSALIFKKEPENRTSTIKILQDIGLLDVKTYVHSINTIVEPVNASDLFKLESCYIPKIHKAYTNYNSFLEEKDVFANVIRATYPIRDESNINSWRFLNPLSYYIIENTKGDIVHLFGAGKAFYIHTKHNLLVTSKDAKLITDNTDINVKSYDIFDIEPRELFTSDLGYGGLKYRECQLFSQFGYIWYDTDRHKLFRFDNGNLVDINSGIDEILKKYNYEYCYINIDNESNRIFFAFKKDGVDDLTLSYDTLDNKWLSLYDFTFDSSIHTVDYCLFNLKGNVELYKYFKDAPLCDYSKLSSINNDFPHYNTLIKNNDINKYCCFDIIFNKGYIIPKSLDSISWVHEIIKRNTINNSHPAELQIINTDIDDRQYDLFGVTMDIYTDSTDTGLLSLFSDKLNDVANINNPEGYKYPYYNKGVWNFNYFRNNISEELNIEEIRKLAERYEMKIDSFKNLYKVLDKDGKYIYRSSDMRTLIYGKYIAIRFIFHIKDKLKFDNLEINIKKY